MNLKLKDNADFKSLIYIVITTALFVSQWIWFGVNPFLYTWFLFMSVAVAVMTHNHNHLPMWRSKVMNVLTDWWLTVFYGFPIFAWIPTHNKNHHKFNNREGDDSITYRVSEKNNFLTLVSYPTISGYYQQKAIANYLKDMKANNKEKVLDKYGERIFRIYEIFLAWSVMIGKHGGSTAYQIVCHKNLDKFDRTTFIGATNLGEHDKFKKTTELKHD